jgi:hypothetical protein
MLPVGTGMFSWQRYAGGTVGRWEAKEVKCYKFDGLSIPPRTEVEDLGWILDFVFGKLRYEEILIILLELRLGVNTEVESREVCPKRM